MLRHSDTQISDAMIATSIYRRHAPLKHTPYLSDRVPAVDVVR